MVHQIKMLEEERAKLNEMQKQVQQQLIAPAGADDSKGHRGSGADATATGMALTRPRTHARTHTRRLRDDGARRARPTEEIKDVDQRSVYVGNVRGPARGAPC